MGLGRIAAAAAALGVLAAGCGDSGFHYVKNSEERTYFKVPGDWRLFDEDAIFASQRGALSPQGEAATRRIQWVVAFDADPEPSLAHVFDARSGHPAGIARVRTLSAQERDRFSLASLRTELLQGDPVAQASAGNPNVEVLKVEDISRPGGFRGNRMVANLKRPDGTFFTIDQTSLVDGDTEKVYVLMVGCEARCYVRNQDDIEKIADSWTVKKR